MAMELEFKPDFAETRERWDRFWQGESDRPMLFAIRPKPGVEAVEKPRPYACAFGDLEALADQAVAWASTHEFLGDAVPSFMVTFAPDHFAALLGGEIKRPDSGHSNWVKPCLSSLEGAEIRFQRDGQWWQRTLECIDVFRSRCDGKLILTSTHLQGGLDCLAALLGTQEVLMELAINPQGVHDALRQVDQALVEVREAFAEALDVATWGSVNRFGMYSSGVIDVPQCDLSCMISQDMFREFQLPTLTREIATTDASVYHLDSAGALPHLEALCSIEQLDMIQWMPGEGHYDDDHRELNDRIDSLGKGQIFQHYYKFGVDEITRIWNTYQSRKLFFQVTPGVFDVLSKKYLV